MGLTNDSKNISMCFGDDNEIAFFESGKLKMGVHDSSIDVWRTCVQVD